MTTQILASKKNVRSVLNRRDVTENLERIATKYLSTDTLKAQALLAIAREPKLLKCSQFSFLESLTKAAELGLRPGGLQNECHLIPYGTKAELIIGTRGLCELARRSGKISKIECHVVYSKDDFSLEYGTEQQIKHRPCLTADRGEIVGAYSVAILTDATQQTEFMSKAEIDNIRKRSPSGSNGPWKTDYPEMARKTVLRRICKYLPMPLSVDRDMIETEKPQERKSVDSIETPENIDTTTGEILENPAGDVSGDVSETVEDSEDSQPDAEEPARGLPCDPLSADIAEQKAGLIDELLTVLGQLYPGDDIKNDAERLKKLKYIFGKTDLSNIAKFPVQILEAGLKALKDQLTDQNRD